MSKKDKGRLSPFVPLLLSTIRTPAWLAMSHGAKSLYVTLKSHVPNSRNEAFLSHRMAQKEVGSCRRKIAEWFRELEHYGFIVMAQPGCLGVEGKGIQALARWESASKKKPWSKPAILSDEPRDFAEFPLNDELAA